MLCISVLIRSSANIQQWASPFTAEITLISVRDMVRVRVRVWLWMVWYMNNDLFLMRTRLKFGERAFSVAAPKAWNKLPLDVRTVTNIDTFKTKLKTFLFPTVN